MIKGVDTHCHIDDKRYDEDREEIIKKSLDELLFFVNIGHDMESSRKTLKLSNENKNIFGTVGIHPTNIKEFSNENLKEIKKLLDNKKIVALGEIGLDYHWMEDPKEEQIRTFKEFMDLALEKDMPVVIHSRDAMEDTLDVLDEYKEVGGIFHCYPGSHESVKKISEKYYLGIGGVVTFKNSKKLKKVVEEIPLERLVLETDAPYLTPTPYRGKRNEPSYIKYVASEIAKIKGVDVEEVLRVTTENALKAYRIDKDDLI